MVHALTAVLPIINHNTIATIQLQLLSHTPCHYQQMAQQLLVIVAAGGQLSERLLRDDEGMDGGLGVDVVEGEGVFVFVDDLCGDLVTSDLCRQTDRQLRGGSIDGRGTAERSERE